MDERDYEERLVVEEMARFCRRGPHRLSDTIGSPVICSLSFSLSLSRTLSPSRCLPPPSLSLSHTTPFRTRACMRVCMVSESVTECGVCAACGRGRPWRQWLWWRGCWHRRPLVALASLRRSRPGWRPAGPAAAAASIRRRRRDHHLHHHNYHQPQHQQ